MTESLPDDIRIIKSVERVTATNKLHTLINVVLSLNDFEVMNRASFDTEDTSLQLLADFDARRAYKIAKFSLNHLVYHSQGRVTLDGTVIADKGTTTVAERRTIAKNAVAAMLPDEDIIPFDFHIAVHASSFDTHAIGFDAADTIPVVDMQVEPPQLAA